MEKESALKTKKSKKAVVPNHHPDHDSLKPRLSRIRGQIDGIERMIDERRYCVDIINQMKAVQSALKSLEMQVLEGHLRACVRSTFESKNAFDAEKKIKEIVDLL